VTADPLSAIQSPFQRLRDLLSDEPPGAPPIDMTIGEPRHGFPQFVGEILARHGASFGKYPPIAGIPELRLAIGDWLARRCALPAEAIDQDKNILPLCGTREGLVSALVIAAARKNRRKPAVLMPNPFYQAYYAAAIACGCEPVLLEAAAATGFLPDLDAIEEETLARTAAFYLASPANPQGAVASAEYLRKLIGLARAHDFYVFSDECYSEIYKDEPPLGALSLAADTGSFDKVLIFNSLSKRSNVPGMRSGFIAGEADFIAAYLKFRNVACPQVPLPIQHVSAALWRDEAHVERSRALYREKFRLASGMLRGRFGYYEPDGGFFLWLDMSEFGGGEAAAKTIWKECGVKILPGAYLAQPDERGLNPAFSYARLALVDPLETTGEALGRLGLLAR
jgi:aspartate/methionine/tyrosine aminotransferase